ncbi:DUF4241 domain-containing protein [Microbacterium gorillae]|uniref:DUF4241 domain-containing protein n=1 Tax=Microbacterium gorillae TaxID=1231063 RepID=UPI003D9592C1
MWTPWSKSRRVKSPEARVLAFLTDYQDQHKTAAGLYAQAQRRVELLDEFFRQWRSLLEPVRQRHFAAASPVRLGESFSSSAAYGSRREDYIRTDIVGAAAYVLFDNAGGPHRGLHEYVVENLEGEFKIVDILTHYSDPALPSVDAATIAELQRDCASDAAFIAVPEYEASLDENRNFTDREVRDPDDGEISQASVTRVGELSTATGILTITDFGWDNHYARPLAHTVVPGTYPVDRVTAFGRNAAVRVVFGERRPVSWKLANCAGGENDTVGVDHGSLCIADFTAYLSMTPRDKNVVFARFADAPKPAAGSFGLGAGNVGFACETGWGDGRYPVYWGLDEDDRIVQLVVDFFVLVRKVDGEDRHI